MATTDDVEADLLPRRKLKFICLGGADVRVIGWTNYDAWIKRSGD